MAISLTSTNTSGAVNVNGVDVLTADAGGNVSLRTGGVNQSVATLPTIKQGIAVTTTGAAAYDFTGIPTGVKRITVMFNDVSTNGTAFLLLQLGSGAVQNTGYLSTATFPAGGATTGSTQVTSGFAFGGNAAANSVSGTMSLVNLNANLWVGSHSGSVNNTQAMVGGGRVTITGALDRIRITTVNGTDVFDAGSVNITWEF